MDCPYCQTQMRPGYIPQDRYALRWVPDDSTSVLSLIGRGKDSVKLSDTLESFGLPAHLCQNCGKLIIDLPKEHLPK